MARSQLEFDITANNKPAVKKINEVKKAGVDATEEIQAKNNEATKAAIGMIAPMAIAVQGLMTLLAGISESVRKYFAMGEVFIEWGKKAEISAQSAAYLKAEADAAGVSAKDFEQAMADLGAGKTSIAKLREEWEGLGDSIKTATNAQENFEKLARAKNYTIFGDGASKFFGGVANGALELIGMGGTQLAAVERAAYEGKSYEEAVKEAQKARRGWHAPVIESRMRAAYETAKSNALADEKETETRLINETAKKLAEADISNAEKERLFREFTGGDMPIDEIKRIAEEQKSRDEKMNETIKGIADEEKKAREADKKERDRAAKIVDEGRKLGIGMKDAFTQGGGLIGNAVYGQRNEDWRNEQLKLLREQYEFVKKQTQSLTNIETAIVED